MSVPQQFAKELEALVKKYRETRLAGLATLEVICALNYESDMTAVALLKSLDRTASEMALTQLVRLSRIPTDEANKGEDVD
jgi:hypothetical protein